jgi:Tol biopolymer transport system component
VNALCTYRDSKSVIFSSNRARPANTGQLFLVDADGKNLRKVTNGPGGFAQPGFSADNRKIYAYQSCEGADYEYGNIAVFKL